MLGLYLSRRRKVGVLIILRILLFFFSDNEERENRVVLLLGPTSSQKSELIDFLCNYFYGVDSMDQRRFHISNEVLQL